MSHSNLGAVLYRLGDFEGAAAAYQEALRLDPGLAMARNNLQLLRMRLGGTSAPP
jgi:Flp pilus assembly protein TadD